MVYDQVHELAKMLTQSEEHQEYIAAKKAAFESETNVALLNEYRKLSMQAQPYVMAGEQPPSEMLEKLQKLYAVLQMSNECMQFLMCEYKLQMVMNEIFGILSKAVDLDMSFLAGDEQTDS